VVREGAHGSRDRNVDGDETGNLVLPIEMGGRSGRLRQPVELEIVEDVVACEPPAGACEELVQPLVKFLDDDRGVCIRLRSPDH